MPRALHHLVLQRRFFFQDAQRRQVVLDLLIAGEHRLAIGRHLRVVGGDRLVRHRAALAGVEDRLRGARAEGPEAAGGYEECQVIGAAVAQGGGERERREVSGLGDADLRVGRRHLPLRGGDVGAPLEEIRGQRERHLRHLHAELAPRERIRRPCHSPADGSRWNLADGIALSDLSFLSKPGVGMRKLFTK